MLGLRASIVFWNLALAAGIPLALVPQDPEPSPSATPNATNGTTADATDIAWTYTSADKWGTLSPAFSLCGEGQKQSPVNVEKVKLSTKDSSGLPLLVATFKPSAIKLENDGHNIFMKYEPGSSIKLGDVNYEVKRLVFKSPSEHTISGQAYAMEVQIECKANGTDDTAIIAVLMQEHQNANMKNQFLDKFWSKLPAEAMSQAAIDDTTVDAADLCPKDITYYSSTGGLRIAYPYYSYEGSMTQPPCTENVKWFVWYKPIDVFADQVKSFRAIMEKMGEKEGNRRPLQALNDRTVEFKTLF